MSLAIQVTLGVIFLAISCFLFAIAKGEWDRREQKSANRNTKSS